MTKYLFQSDFKTYVEQQGQRTSNVTGENDLIPFYQAIVQKLNALAAVIDSLPLESKQFLLIEQDKEKYALVGGTFHMSASATLNRAFEALIANNNLLKNISVEKNHTNLVIKAKTVCGHRKFIVRCLSKRGIAYKQRTGKTIRDEIIDAQMSDRWGTAKIFIQNYSKSIGELTVKAVEANSDRPLA